MEGNFDLLIDGRKFAATKIYKAIISGSHLDLNQCIHQGENVHAVDADFQTTYLHLVVQNYTDTSKHLPMIYVLSNAGISLNQTDYKNQTAVDLAAASEKVDAVCALLRCGASFPTGSAFIADINDAIEQFRPGLQNAVLKDDVGMVTLLMNCWCRVRVKCGERSLRELAHVRGCADIARILTDMEITLEFVHATLAGDERRMLELLMDSKHIDTYILDISHQQPRSLRETAINMGHKHVLHLLPEDDLDDVYAPVNKGVNAGDVQGGKVHRTESYAPPELRPTARKCKQTDGASVYFENWTENNPQNRGDTLYHPDATVFSLNGHIHERSNTRRYVRKDLTQNYLSLPSDRERIKKKKNKSTLCVIQ